jgi:hypothetical protein
VRSTWTPSPRKTSSKTVLNLEIAVSEQKLGPQLAVLEPPGQVPCLLHHPGSCRTIGTAGQMDAAAANLDEEHHLEPGQPDGVDHVMPISGLCRRALGPSSVPDVEFGIIARVHAIEIECPRIIGELDYRARSPICGSFRALRLGWIMPSIPRAPEFHRPAFSA